jgi:hypothetical protein
VTLTNGDTKPLYMVSHRRGPKVHKFVSTFGTTVPGHEHKLALQDDEDAASSRFGAFSIERKCPSILNTATEAQPAIDRFNRYRQAILAMEKRLLTTSFGVRFITTLLGTVCTNAWFAKKYFSSEQLEFRAEMQELALKLMTNSFLPSSPSSSGSPPPFPPGKGEKRSREGSPTHEEHRLVPIRTLKANLRKVYQLKCNVCNKKTTYVCLTCSTVPNGWWPCHPHTTHYRGQTRKHTCLSFHQEQPDVVPRGRRPNKRARASPAPEVRESDDDDDEMFDSMSFSLSDGDDDE